MTQSRNAMTDGIQRFNFGFCFIFILRVHQTKKLRIKEYKEFQIKLLKIWRSFSFIHSFKIKRKKTETVLICLF